MLFEGYMASMTNQMKYTHLDSLLLNKHGSHQVDLQAVSQCSVNQGVLALAMSAFMLKEAMPVPDYHLDMDLKLQKQFLTRTN